MILSRMRATRRARLSLCPVLLLLASCGGAGPAEGLADEQAAPAAGQPPPIAGAAVTAPDQPLQGPGGAQYRYAGIVAQSHGLLGQAYWLVTPEAAGDALLPVIYFLHGYGLADTAPYRSWIEHLVRRGAIVIYPNYQFSALTALRDYTPNSVAAIRDALLRLEAGTGPRPDYTRVAAIGHSMGGAIAANLAASAGAQGIPQPRALLTINPSNGSGYGSLAMPLEDFAQIPSTTLLLSMYSDRDDRVSDDLARQLFHGATAVDLADKDYVILNSDAHGSPALLADHFAALAGRAVDSSLYPPDALDWYGLWKLGDALMSAAFHGLDRDIALGGGSEAQRAMGYWSDGRAVAPLSITDSP